MRKKNDQKKKLLALALKKASTKICAGFFNIRID